MNSQDYGYRVSLPQSVEGTGLDQAVFATAKECEQAVQVLSSARRVVPEKCDVIRVSNSPNTTFTAWNESGW